MAEVLITLGIIGIIAALTLPSLMAKHQEKVTVTALKKFYSTASQAYNLAVNEYGSPPEWASDPTDTPLAAKEYLDILAKYMKITKNCGISTDDNCFSYEQLKGLSGEDENLTNATQNYSKAQLADGEFIYLRIDEPQCKLKINNDYNYCGYISADINGAKGSGVIGRDNFRFYITNKGILPYGIKDDEMYSFKDNCTLSSYGYGCTAWVIFNENMDYLHCDDLEWDTKTTCK